MLKFLLNIILPLIISLFTTTVTKASA